MEGTTMGFYFDSKTKNMYGCMYTAEATDELGVNIEANTLMLSEYGFTYTLSVTSDTEGVLTLSSPMEPEVSLEAKYTDLSFESVNIDMTDLGAGKLTFKSAKAMGYTIEHVVNMEDLMTAE